MKLQCVAAVLCLATVLQAAASARPYYDDHRQTAEPQNQQDKCQLTGELSHCLDQIKENNMYRNGGRLLSPGCCEDLAKNLGCACFIRDKIKEALSIDIQEPFCVPHSGCKN